MRKIKNKFLVGNFFNLRVSTRKFGATNFSLLGFPLNNNLM